MIECPLCHQLRERLSANGYCHDCPEYAKWLSATSVQGSDKKSGGYKRISKLSGKAQGRSGKVHRVDTQG